MHKITVIGGGTGVFTVLTGLKQYPVDLTAIISMADDGGSTGILREEFGILPPGDVRRALVALSDSDNKLLSELFNYRFGEGGFCGHNFGNIMLTALERLTGNFERAINEAGRLLNVHGQVIPVTLKKVSLRALLEDGSMVRGETNIDIPKHNSNLKINKIWLTPHAGINPRAALAIKNSDLIIIGPGDLYTSILPNIIVSGVPESLKKSKAIRVYIVNVMTKDGETNRFAARDFISTIENYLGRGVIDYVLVNTKKPSAKRLRAYAKEKSTFVDFENLPLAPKPILDNFLRNKTFIRHDPAKLARILINLLNPN